MGRWVGRQAGTHIITNTISVNQSWVHSRSLARHRPIMPKILSIMLLSIAQKLSLLCSKLCFQNQDYALELTVVLEHISLS